MSIQSRLRAIVGAVLLVIISGMLGFHLISRGETSFIDCLYMTIITITTVGFGDDYVKYAHQPFGRVFIMLLLITGMGLLTYGVSTMTAFFVEGELSALLWRRKMLKTIEKMKGHFIVVGVGNTGLYVMQEMQKTGREFIAIDRDGERMRKLAEQNPFVYLAGDATDDKLLLDACIERAHGLVTALPDDKDNLFVTLSARQLNPNLRIIAKGVDSHARNKLMKAGADSVVSPNLIGGLRMVSEMIRPAAVGFLDMMLRDTQHTVRIEDVKISEQSPLCGKTLREAAIPQKFSLLVMATREMGSDTFNYAPGPEVRLTVGMDIVLLGEVGGLKQLRDVCSV